MTTSELDTIAKLEPTERVAALKDYLQRGEARLTAARAIRDDAIRELRAANKGLTRAEIAALTGVSVAHVAAVTAKPKT